MNQELQEYFNAWLDTVQEVFGEVLTEWDENEYVQIYDDAQTEFQCNDCGKCCNLKDHDVWIYPFDLIKWLQKLNKEKMIPLFLSAVVPVKDFDDVRGIGLPTQKQIISTYQEIIQQKKGKKNKIIRKTLSTILTLLKKINPNFNSKSDYCIYYDPNPSKKDGHCLIYPYRPIQCRAYPYDYPMFSKIDIPQIDKKEDKEKLPMCPSETYSKGDPTNGVKITEEQRKNVLLEKANYRTSTVIKNWGKKSKDWQKISQINLVDMLLELFHEDIEYLTRKQKLSINNKNSSQNGENNKKSKAKSSTRYVAGKRPRRG